MKTITTIVGARPQFVKASVVSQAIAEIAELNEVVIHTGQHYDTNMSGVFFDDLKMPPPDYQLDAGGGKHGEMTAKMLQAIESILIEHPPDVLLVYGDTNSTLAGALAAAKLHIPVAHVEAGLRSYNRRMPEEVNRVVTDHVASLLFAPSDVAAANLRGEGIDPATIFVTGDVMLDIALRFKDWQPLPDSSIQKLRDKPYALATVHRAENTDSAERLSIILDGLESVATELQVVWPVHPRLRERAAEWAKGLPKRAHVVLLEPLGYPEMMYLQRHASVVITDSGGVQKEAFFHRTPCVTLRDETEWTELVHAGWNQLCPPSSATDIYEAIRSAIGTQGTDISPYGDGDAGEKIAAILATVAPRQPIA